MHAVIFFRNDPRGDPLQRWGIGPYDDRKERGGDFPRMDLIIWYLKEAWKTCRVTA